MFCMENMPIDIHLKNVRITGLFNENYNSKIIWYMDF